MLHEAKNVFKKYAVFKGRSSRREFWFFILFEICVYLPLLALLVLLEGIKISEIFESAENLAASLLSSLLLGDSLFTSPWVSLIKALLIIFALGVFIPRLSVTIRRLHDINRSGWFYLIKVIPEIIAAIIAIILSGNKFFIIKNYYLIIFSLLLLLAGNIVLIIMLAKKGDPETNPYGVPPSSSDFAENDSRDTAEQSVTETISNVHEPTVQIKIVCNTGALAGQVFSSSDMLCIGRSKSSCNVVFPENTRGISRVHCCLKIDHGQPLLIDMGSSYGTFLENGKKLQPNVPVRINDNTRFYLADKNTRLTAYVEIR